MATLEPGIEPGIEPGMGVGNANHDGFVCSQATPVTYTPDVEHNLHQSDGNSSKTPDVIMTQLGNISSAFISNSSNCIDTSSQVKVSPPARAQEVDKLERSRVWKRVIDDSEDED